MRRSAANFAGAQTMGILEALGYLASGLVVLTFCMKTMMPLRIVAIGSNLAFIAYGLDGRLIPILVLHSILLPLNTLRLYQMHRLLKKIRKAAEGDLSLEGLLPFMSRRRVKRGEVLFRKGDRAQGMFYVASGRVQFEELGKSVATGAVLGEISMFSPSKQRTATAVCETDGELLVMSDDKVKELYYQNPEFGFNLVQLITKRLIENCETAEASSGRWPHVEGLSVQPAA
jgi:CRP/FNR family cyclic AMP-dependent transcriptional regulator